MSIIGFEHPPGGTGEKLDPDLDIANASGTLRVFNTGTAKPGTSASEALAKFKKLRLAYVKAMGWLPEAEDDTDEYDEKPDTLNLLSVDPEDSKILVGMRLTRVSSMEQSLSWGMLRANPAMQNDALNSIFTSSLRKAEASGRLFDLTRVVAALDGSVRDADIATGVLDLIGAGIFSMRRSPDEEKAFPTAWFFVTTDGFREFLESVRISHYVLATGIISEGDEEVSHVCVAYPQEALEIVKKSSLKQAQFTYNRVNAAMESLLA